MNEAPSTLIIGPSWIGDLTMAQSLFMLLKQRQPDVQIDVLAPTWSYPLLARMPEVAQPLDMPLRHGEFGLKRRYEVSQQLPRDYQQAIVLPNSFKSAFIPLFARIPQRTGWRGEMRFGLLNDIRKLDKAKLPLMVQRFAALALPKHETLADNYPRPRLQTSEAETQLALQAHHLDRDKPILALCPGAEYGSAKRWPTEYYAEIANARLSEGWQVWILGSAKEATLAAEIQMATQGRCSNLSGSTSLAEVIDLLSQASMVLANDSGLMHIAASLQRPLIAFYGSTHPNFAPPLCEQAKIMWLDLSCSPCRKRECPLSHLACLREIKPAQVLQEMEILESESAYC